MEEDYRDTMAREDKITDIENELSDSKSRSNGVLSLPPVKKNCLNCEHLEWVDTGGECGGVCGYCCNRRDYRTELEEDNHLGQLEKESYLEKVKSCCDPKQ